MVILTLIVLCIAFVPTLFLDNGGRLLWQLSNKAWMLASMLIAIISILFTIHYIKGKHCLLKILIWPSCFVMVMGCLISLYIAMVKHDEKIWSDKEYVVYSEYYDFFDPNRFVLYKRDGLIDRRMFFLGDIGFGEMKEADYSGEFSFYPMELHDVPVKKYFAESEKSSKPAGTFVYVPSATVYDFPSYFTWKGTITISLQLPSALPLLKPYR